MRPGMALQTQERLTLDKQLVLNRAVRAVTYRAILRDGWVLEREWSDLIRMALVARFGH